MGKKKESKLVKYLLIGISILFLFVMLVLPLFVVVTEALKKGWQVYVEAVTDSFTIAALMLTLKATVIAVLCNTVLGLCAAWAVTRFQFKGKKISDDSDRCTSHGFANHCRSDLSSCIWKTEHSLPVSAKSKYPDCICCSGNHSGYCICNISICFS